MENSTKTKPNRHAKKPNRLGCVEHAHNSKHSSDEETDPYEDNDSLDDYIPTPKKSKNSVYSYIGDGITSITAQRNNSSENRQKFNRQFDSLLSNTQMNNANESNKSKQMHIDQRKTAHVQMQPQHSSNTTHHGAQNTCMCERNQMQMLRYVENVNAKLDEILSRFSVLEDTILGNIAIANKQGKADDQNELNMFMKSNSLPAKNIDDLKKFETNLKDLINRKATVR